MRYHVGNQTVEVGDAFDILWHMDRSQWDVVVTSPQYNLKVSYDTTKDNLPLEVYLQQMREYARLLRHVLKRDGSLFLVVGHSCLEPWRGYEVAGCFTEQFVLQNRILWVKSITVDGHSHGHYKPINSKRFVNDLYEEIFHLTLEGDVEIDRLAVGVPYEDKSNISRWESPKVDLRCRGNVWYIPYNTITDRKLERGGHPATFPPLLAEQCIRLHGVREDLRVLDPMVGTGSTLLAAYKLGVEGYGVDLSENYVQVAVRNLQEAQC